MSLDANSLLASLLVSSIGMVLFIYGKRQSRLPHMGVGIVMLVYPYFVGSPLWMLGIAALLVAALIGAVRLGW
ncbi:MAG: hypothetical protein IPI67_09850 [Myxococcales bacterium]|nr:hypothetical protein [Myxococcales bacterium]